MDSYPGRRAYAARPHPVFASGPSGDDGIGTRTAYGRVPPNDHLQDAVDRRARRESRPAPDPGPDRTGARLDEEHGVGLVGQPSRLGYVELEGRLPPGPSAACPIEAGRAGHLGQDELRDALRPLLEAVAASTEETVTLSIEIGKTRHTAGAILVVDHIESRAPGARRFTDSR